MVIAEYERLPNESDEELIYRVCSEKNQIGSWQVVANILNELLHQEYTESKYRKQYQAFEKMFAANRAKFVSPGKIDAQLEELRKERMKLQTLNLERNRIDRVVARRELYNEYIKDVITTLPVPEFRPLYVDNCNETRYVLAIADVHYGATFESENNEYSPDIIKRRFEYLATELEKFVETHQIRHLCVVSLGDTIQGLLRINDIKLNDSSMVKATVEISRLIALFLNHISKFVEVTYYHVPTANHSQIRPLGSKPGEISAEDMEYVISNYIQDLCFKNERIHVVMAEEGKNYIDIHKIIGFEITAMHGHTLKNPENALRDLIALRDTNIDYLITGHFHGNKTIQSHEGVCHDCEVLVAPSFCGSDPYSDSLMKGSKAAVKIFGFHELYGHTETYKIILN